MAIRHERPQLDSGQSHYVRLDQAMGGTFAQLWFLTRGCTWDRRGECTMCNYGQSSSVSDDAMVSFVRAGLDSIDVPLDELYVSPSGSLLDPREVPPSARRRILDLVASFPVERFSFETRPETLTPQAAAEIAAALPGKRVAAGLGLESADPWVRHFCINKHNATTDFRRAMSVLKSHGIGIYVNVGLGHAFLTPQEAIDDARASIEWSLGTGADLVLVFPMHVKSYTLLAWLHDRGLYEPPSLWALIDVLRSIHPSDLPRVNISWYRADYGTDPGVIASPTTCPYCQNEVFDRLDRFRADPSLETLESLDSVTCACRARWSKSLSADSDETREQRVYRVYELLAHEFGLEDWWKEHLADLLADLGPL